MEENGLGSDGVVVQCTCKAKAMERNLMCPKKGINYTGLII